jgi:ATP-dependent DNA helicase RecG
MEKTNDGFLIADEDLKLRGPGEYFGVKQSGFFQYKIANMATDRAIIQKARKAAFKLIDNDPALQDRSNKSLRQTFLKAYAHRLDDINLS